MREWNKTRVISMSVQTAELQVTGTPRVATLATSASLISIARGTCYLKISPTRELKATTGNQIEPIGQLHIEATRPVMHGDLAINQSDFHMLYEHMRYSPPRPATIFLGLSEELDVSVEGDLAITSAQTIPLLDISWNIPLQ